MISGEATRAAKSDIAILKCKYNSDDSVVRVCNLKIR